MFTRFKQKSQEPFTSPLSASSKNVALLLLAAILISVSFSFYSSVLSWVLLIVVCGGVIRVAIHCQYYKHLPSIRTLNLLAVLSILGLVYSAMSAGVLFGMVNLLILACALKLMQVRHQKDVYQLIISLFFLIGCGFIFNQSIGFSLLYVLLCSALLLSLICYHAPSITIQKQLKTIAIISLQALPIGLLMFLILPQLPPLWHTPKAKGAQTGLSEHITPGDIASLSQSSDLAFRATFKGTPPIARQRYWRAIVMEDFDGKTWKVHTYRHTEREFQLQANQQFTPKLRGPILDYEVIAEPTYQPWLFALDIAVPADAQSNANIMQNNDFTLFSRQPVASQYQYAVRSYTEALASQTFTVADKRLNLTLPEKGNNRTRKWISSLRLQFQDDNQFIQAVLDYFVEQPFVYTLRPELMLTDPVDSFLFENQAGFCSHYASALAYALRLGDIPARLVTGYQGGELVENTGELSYLSIYQYDAHAWVEIWSKQNGWQRIDPTALVSPDRIEFGLRRAMQTEGSFLADSPFALARLTNIAWLNNIRLFLADVDYNWSRWVLGFNKEKQRDLFKSIVGKLTVQNLSILGVGIVLVIACLLGMYFLPHWLQNSLSTTQRLYIKALNEFEKAGTQRATWLGPSAFSQQISELYSPNVSAPFVQITQLYLHLTYKNNAGPNVCEQSLRKGLRKGLKSRQMAPAKAPSLPSLKQSHRMMRRHLARLKTELRDSHAYTSS